MLPINKDDLTYKQEKNFMSKVDINPDLSCWIWKGCIGPDGYGRCIAGKRTVSPARLSWVLFKGDLIGTERITTICGNKLCCNPEHLVDMNQAKTEIIHKEQLRLRRSMHSMDNNLNP